MILKINQLEIFKEMYFLCGYFCNYISVCNSLDCNLFIDFTKIFELHNFSCFIDSKAHSYCSLVAWRSNSVYILLEIVSTQTYSFNHFSLDV